MNVSANAITSEDEEGIENLKDKLKELNKENMKAMIKAEEMLICLNTLKKSNNFIY